MKRTVALVMIAVGICLTVQVTNALAQATEFTYQGSLKDGVNQASGNYDFEFALFDVVAGGAQQGVTLTRSAVPVANGIFTVLLDFGNQFPGAGRFLEIRVRPAGFGGFTTLSPRQSISSGPYSIKTLSADTAANTTQLGGIAANQYLLKTGDGSGLTNLNAASMTSGTLSNARIGQLPTANIADSAVTAAKIANGQVVKTLSVGANTLTDNVTLANGPNITLTPTGNTVTINSTGLVGGNGTLNSIPVWTSPTTIGNSTAITQSPAGVQLPNTVQLGAGTNGHAVFFGSPNSQTGMTLSGPSGRADIRYDAGRLYILNGPGGIPPVQNGFSIDTSGRATIGSGFATNAVFTASVPDTSNGAIAGFGNLYGVQGATETGWGIWGTTFGIGATGRAGQFSGNVRVSGFLEKAGGGFKIDHPLDPAQKFLNHSFVESPDMMNMYNGNAAMDENGEAVIVLPNWFETLNRDFRYQLTAVGAPGPNLYIAQEVSNNQFKIGGGMAGMKVSWQLTGVRQDKFANANRLQVEEEKPAIEQGFYLHPLLFGQPEEKGSEWAYAPEQMRLMKQQREKAQQERIRKP